MAKLELKENIHWKSSANVVWKDLILMLFFHFKSYFISIGIVKYFAKQLKEAAQKWDGFINYPLSPN